MITPAQHVAIAATALVGGAMNAIAGGGTLLTFPALIGLGVPSLIANATSTVAYWPGTLASFVGYRAEWPGIRAWALRFLAPSALGGLVGGVLLTATSQRRFDQIVPFLVLFATMLFVLQRRVLDVLRRRVGYVAPAAGASLPTAHLPAFLAFHFLVAVYGGYFGGGVGMVMLAAFGLMGLTNIHQMNGLKNFCGLTFNLVAIAAFVLKGLVDWPIALNMAIGSTLGGWIGSGLAQRVPQASVRGAVGVIGFGAGLWLLLARA
jgi:uncharacterized membrane protein YfcA